ncbi:mitochondrial carrier [Athelia psychrophila]|uniref:Mitochondrial carrier n=1 Tax=Athelia psychrophila TaxID=1759441 RepID=A0A166UBY7_9AGAM|nr:mitochondrial carrier [Fibularhizoctonia sp. CBS 109695]
MVTLANASTKPTRNTDKQSFHFIIRSGLAGGVAGCVAKTVVAPLDRVKILFQASNPDFNKYAGTWSGAYKAGRVIYRDGGVRGLLQGHSATLVRVFPYAAVKFMAYDQVHHVLMPTRESETNARRFSAGAISGIISVFFTYPLEVIRVRMAFQTRLANDTSSNRLRPSLSRAISQIYHETGATPLPIPTPKQLFFRFPVLKFYRGFSVTVMGMVPYAGTSFLAWGYLRARFLPAPSSSSEKAKPTPLADLIIGAVSGAVSQTVSYPFEVVRRRMQVGGLSNPDRWLRLGETVHAVWAAGGWKGFFTGLGIGYLKIVPMTAVSYAVWQEGKRVLGV